MPEHDHLAEVAALQQHRAAAPFLNGGQAIEEIVSRAGSQFDPDCANALADLDHAAMEEVVATGR